MKRTFLRCRFPEMNESNHGLKLTLSRGRWVLCWSGVHSWMHILLHIQSNCLIKMRARNEACLCHLHHGFIQTKKVNCGECCVCLHCLTQEDSPFSSDVIICWWSRSQNDLFQCERENVKSTWKIKSNKSCVHFQCFAQLFCSVGTN